MNLFISPFVNALFGFYYLTGNFGWSIIIVTILIKAILMPLVWPSMKNANKMRDLQPKLKKLQEKYKGKKEELAKAQMELYKQEGINPLSGCLPQILQIAVLLLFFSAFNNVSMLAEKKINIETMNKNLIPAFQLKSDFKFNVDFIGSDLTLTPAKIFNSGWTVALVLPMILLLGSAILQYLGSKVMMPSPKVDENITKKTENKEDDMMSAMRTQSLYMMPAMTLFIGWNFSLGILLYWFVNSLTMWLQQLIVNKFNK